MTDNMETEIVRGKDAEQLLANPLLQEAFTLIEKELIEQWQTSPVRDADARETLYLSQLLLQRLQLQLRSVVETGLFAQASLAQRLGKTLNRVFS